MSKIKKFSEVLVLYSINISFILYIIVLLGVGGFAPQYLEILNTFLRIYIGCLLVITYNPFTYTNRQFGEFDRQLVFSSGIFLLLSTTIVSSIHEYLRSRTQQLVGTGIKSVYKLGI
jgi:hypothetical protein